MRILAIHLAGMPEERLFADENLVNIRQLLQIGCFGRLATGEIDPVALLESTLLSALAQLDKRPVILELQAIMHGGSEIDGELFREQLRAVSKEAYRRVRSAVEEGDWDYLQFTDTALEQIRQLTPYLPSLNDDQEAYILYQDRETGGLLELLSDDMVVLLLASHSAHGAEPRRSSSFILASANNPLHDETGEVSSADLAATVLALAGCQLPASLPGKALVELQDKEPNTDLTEDEEALLRERLSGLGYF